LGLRTGGHCRRSSSSPQFEADDALASAAAKAAQDDRVQVIIWTPDKDLSQCVVGSRVVQLDRQRKILRDEAGVNGKFGVKPLSIPDYLAVVGDSADGYPGISGWGSKTAAAVFSQYPHLEDIPKDWRHWDPILRRARPLAELCLSKTSICVRRWELWELCFFIVLSADADFSCVTPCYSAFDLAVACCP
jgi:5'-3' exonuclease